MGKSKDSWKFVCCCINFVFIIILIVTIIYFFRTRLEEETFNVTKADYPKTLPQVESTEWSHKVHSTEWSLCQCEGKDCFSWEYCINLYVFQSNEFTQILKSYDTEQDCTIQNNCEKIDVNSLMLEINSTVDKYLYQDNTFYVHDDEIYMENNTGYITIIIILSILILIFLCISCCVFSNC